MDRGTSGTLTDGRCGCDDWPSRWRGRGTRTLTGAQFTFLLPQFSDGSRTSGRLRGDTTHRGGTAIERASFPRLLRREGCGGLAIPRQSPAVVRSATVRALGADLCQRVQPEPEVLPVRWIHPVEQVRDGGPAVRAHGVKQASAVGRERQGHHAAVDLVALPVEEPLADEPVRQARGCRAVYVQLSGDIDRAERTALADEDERP